MGANVFLLQSLLSDSLVIYEEKQLIFRDITVRKYRPELEAAGADRYLG